MAVTTRHPGRRSRTGGLAGVSPSAFYPFARLPVTCVHSRSLAVRREAAVGAVVNVPSRFLDYSIALVPQYVKRQLHENTPQFLGGEGGAGRRRVALCAEGKSVAMLPALLVVDALQSAGDAPG